MTTRNIFFASLLIGTLAIHAATARAQSNARVANLPQNEELRVVPSAMENTCRLSVSAQSEAESASGCPRNASPQPSGAWILTFTPNDGQAPPFSSLATFSPDGAVINTAAGATVDTGVTNIKCNLADWNRQIIPSCAPYLPGSASPGIGAWVTQNHEVVITLAHLLYDGMGQSAGVAKVRASLRIYKEATDTILGRYATEIFNNNGETIRSLNGTVAGQRIFAEQLPSTMPSR